MPPISSNPQKNKSDQDKKVKFHEASPNEGFPEGPKEEEGQDAWLMSYADMITLLLGFFAVLLSMSTINQVKVEMFSQYFSKQENKLSMSQLQQLIQQFIQNEKLAEQVNARLTLRGVEISFKDKLLFPSGSADLQPAGLDVIKKMGGLLNYQEIKHRKISVEGHTDSVPIKSPIFPTNWELSSSRASAVVRFFTLNGLEKARFESIGYADTKPIKLETDKKGTPENRRVVVVVKPESYLDEVAEQEFLMGNTSTTTLAKNLSNMQQNQPAQMEATEPAAETEILSAKKPEIPKIEVKQPVKPVTTTPKPAIPAQKPAKSVKPAKINVKQQMELHYNLGIAYIQKNDKVKALKEFEAILKINPTHQPSLLRVEQLRRELRKKPSY